MPVIKVETPNGIEQIEIAGNEPTAQEIAAIEKQFFSKQSKPTVTKVKKQYSKSDGFVKGFQKGFAKTSGAIDKIGDLASGDVDIGQKIKDKLSGKDSKDTKSSSTDDAKAKGGLRFLSKEMGIENPELAVRGINKVQAGKPLNQRELASIKPIIDTIEKALMDQQGRTRLMQLSKMMSKQN